MLKRYLLLESLIVFTIFLLASAAPAFTMDSEAELDRKVHEVGASVMSPYCPGRLLSDCPSTAAAKRKHEIKAKLAAGFTVDQILEELYHEFGEESRAIPKSEGFGLLAWVLPFVVLGIGLLMILRMVKSNKPENGDDD